MFCSSAGATEPTSDTGDCELSESALLSSGWYLDSGEDRNGWWIFAGDDDWDVHTRLEWNARNRTLTVEQISPSGRVYGVLDENNRILDYASSGNIEDVAEDVASFFLRYREPLAACTVGGASWTAFKCVVYLGAGAAGGIWGAVAGTVACVDDAVDYSQNCGK
jgi:hypothetical protein